MSSFVVDILEDFLGDHKKHNEDKGQISFDCPACAEDKGLLHGDGKGNLEVNYEQGVYKCWSCKDVNHMSGYIPTLIKKFGNKKLLKQYFILKPEIKKVDETIEVQRIDVKLPVTFLPLSKQYPYDENYNKAFNYLAERGITQDIIDYYKLGYTTSGSHFLRIILPSYDIAGELNYFSGRAFSWVNPKYLNCDADKTNVIFNENKVNWDATIYLVEGPFDHIVTPNSIPLLGKYMNDLLFETLIEKAKSNIVIVLDADAERDAENLYKKLFYSPVGHLVKKVSLPEEWDIARVHQKYGEKGVVHFLGRAKRLNRFKY